MSQINKDIEKYLEETKKNLVCPAAQKKSMINDLRNSIYDCVDDAKISDINEIYTHFGQPKDIAEQFISEIEPQKIKKAFKIHKLLIVGIVTALLLLTISLVAALIDAHKAHHGYIVEHSPQVLEVYTGDHN